MSELNVVIFDLNGNLFGAETSQVFQIIKYQEPVKVPKMPKFIEGILNYRNSVLPVINLVKRFELGDFTESKKTKILVTRIGDKFAGFIVNDVLEIVRFTDDEVETTPQVVSGGAEKWLKEIGKKGDRLYSIIDLEKILDQGEISKLPTDSEES